MRDLDHNGISYDKNIQTGVMIETPAAIMADAIAQEVDFFQLVLMILHSIQLQ